MSNVASSNLGPPVMHDGHAIRDSVPSSCYATTWALAGQMIVDMVLPIASGALLAVAFMSPPWGLVAWVALVPFAAAVARPRGSAELYAGAYLGGALFSLHAQTWIQTRSSGAGLFGSTTVDWFFNGCFWALAWPLALYLARRVRSCTSLPMMLVVPLVWIAVEYLRQEAGWIVLWSPFPWLQLALTQSPYLHAIQVADLGGVWAVTGVVACINGALFDAISSRRATPLVLGLLILASAWLYGEFRLRTTGETAGPTVALVPAHAPAPYQRVTDADVLLWSETVYPGGVDHSDPESIAALERAARATGSTLIAGCIRVDSGARFNSVVVVDPDEGYAGAYDKCFLVPWSEFRPWSWPTPAERAANFTQGASQPVFAVRGFNCGVSICYDTCFDRLYRAYSPKPDFFAACSCETSDYTGFLPRMLLSMTRLRAVENRRTFVRNVEGGFSGIVTSTGVYLPAPAHPWKGPVPIGRVPIDFRFSLAPYVGDALPIGCLLIIGVAWLRSRFTRKARGEAA